MLSIIVRGAHDTGKTTAASLIKMFLQENGYSDVRMDDLPELPVEQKPDFETRFARNRAAPVRIRVELDAGASTTPPIVAAAPVEEEMLPEYDFTGGRRGKYTGRDVPSTPTTSTEGPRRRMPLERLGKTFKFVFGRGTKNEFRGYFVANPFEDGSLGELFVTLDRAGTFERAMTDLAAVAVSIALQFGAPLELLAEKFMRTRFEPSGATGNSVVPRATSIADLIFRVLLKRFGAKKCDPYENVPLPPPETAAFELQETNPAAAVGTTEK